LIAYNPTVLARTAAWLDRAAFNPSSLPEDVITGIALAPPVVAGLLLYKVPAAEFLGAALACGIAGQLVAHYLWRSSVPRPQASPLPAAVVGVALIGAGARIWVPIAIAAVAVVLELLRARHLPVVRAQVGLLVYALFALVAKNLATAYVNPASGKPFGDPIALWYTLVGPAAPTIQIYDPITLYVGNVAGPVFATSLMAVAVGAAWLAYARRLSFVVTLCFLLGAIVPIALFHWDGLFQLDSGPTWFVAALVLADRRLLPDALGLRPVLGFGAGLLAVGLRTRGLGIEAAFLSVAGVQALMSLFVAALWSIATGRETWERSRRLRRREAQLRVVEGIPKAS
jgi:hypothetical protein